MLLLAFSLFRELRVIRWLVVSWAGVGALVAARGIVQFSAKLSEARALGMNFYEYYEPERITGFMSHWMTFGGQEMFVLLMLMAYLFWSPSARKRGLWFYLLCFATMSTALLLGYTRSIWIATAVASACLIWLWKRWLLALAPVALAIGFLAAPASMRTRARSITSSKDNQVRLVMWRTGLQMVRAHPLLGLGPEEVKIQFMQYLPPDTPRPLPNGWYGHLHNVYLQYAAERGIPAMLLVVWMLLMMITYF